MAVPRKIELPSIDSGIRIDDLVPPEIRYNHPSFDYRDISNKGTKYCFNNNALTKKEFNAYFERIKKICSIPIKSIDGDGQPELNYHIVENPSPLLMNLTKELLKLDKNTSKGMMPPIGQFGVYTENNLSDSKVTVSKSGNVIKQKTPQIKYSPRIFFVIGPKGVFRLLFFDLRHELGNH